MDSSLRSWLARALPLLALLALLACAADAFAQAAPDLKFAAAVAEFGMILRDSEYKGTASLGAVTAWAQQGKGEDQNGNRASFLELVRKTQGLKKH